MTSDISTSAATAPTSGDAYLELRDLTLSYGGVTAVDRVSISVAHGDTLCLLGPSGCGKTTILKAIAGFIAPDSGQIRLGGENLNDVPIHKRDIGFVFQTWALFPHMTVFENVSYGLRMRKVAKAEIRARVEETLALVHLENFSGRRPGELSGGQQQRVALARALVTRPRILLLDEPLSSLDYKIRMELRGELRRIQQELDLTAVYVTHDHSEALALGDQVGVMEVGKMVEYGSPNVIFQAPKTRYVTEFLGIDNVIETARVSSDIPARVREQTVIALSPWDVKLHRRQTQAGHSGEVVGLEHQAGRVLAKVRVPEIGTDISVFATASDELSLGATVNLEPDWAQARPVIDV
jgi:ABC-type Fe3+/spermidine/putrescine transport system ATPase subunit